MICHPSDLDFDYSDYLKPHKNTKCDGWKKCKCLYNHKK